VLLTAAVLSGLFFGARPAAPDGRTFVASDAVGRVYFLRLDNG